MQHSALLVFTPVYLGMFLGRVPGLALDRAVPALARTLAGNLFLVGSIANPIVAEQTAPLGWRERARVGIPVTLLTPTLAGDWPAWLHG